MIIPNFSKWLIGSGEKVSKDSLESNRTAVLSAYSESINKKSIPFVVDLRPVKMKSFLVLKMHNDL